MSGRRKKAEAPAVSPVSPAELGPDGVAPALCGTVPPADVPGWYATAGLPGLVPRRGQSNGVGVWRASPPDLASAWATARALHPRTSLWPVLVSADFWERFDDQTLDSATDHGDGRAWLTSRLTGADQGLFEQLPRRPGPDWRPVGDTAGPAALLVERAEEIVLVEAAAPWLVPGAIGWDGAANHDVMGPEHATVLRRWAAAYGAEPVGLGSDTMTRQVATPPADRESALRAATEAAAYCPDAVFQGVGTLDALAEVLTAGAWFFWWH